MFAQAQWFQSTAGQGLLRPITWQGWVYHGVWIAVLALPLAYLLTQGLFPEALVWLFTNLLALGWDTREVRRQHQTRPARPAEVPEIVFVERGPESRAKARKYDFFFRG